MAWPLERSMRWMRRSLGPLLCELHAHTRWSDGELTVAELVDLHGRSGFDVLCVTDHAVRTSDPWRERLGSAFRSVDEAAFDAYLADVEGEAERARRMYGMLVVPGLELTFNDEDSVKAAHAVAIGLRSYVSVDDGIAEAMRTAAEAGAAVIAAHPFEDSLAGASDGRLTRRFARDAQLRELAHRFELFNRNMLFGWVAESGLPAVAAGDVHRVEHLSGWKTLVPGPSDEEAIVGYLRTQRPVYLARLEAEASRAAA
jgi:3',5'-nucleoside bisphosphate phosphatase